jgi:hypothetical protein
MASKPEPRPFHDVHYFITDREARHFLEQLAQDDPPSELRMRLESEDPREVLLEYNIDIEGIRQPIELPPGEDVRAFLERHLGGEDKSNNVGYAVLYFMLGAMPLVVADGDAAP